MQHVLQTFSIGGNQFAAYLPAQVRSILDFIDMRLINLAYSNEIRRATFLATVIHLEGRSNVYRDWIQQEIIKYESNDDVFCEEFLRGVIFIGGTKKQNLEILPDALDFLHSRGMMWTEVLDVDGMEDCPLPGPFLVSGRQILEIFGLYEILTAHS